MGRRRVERPVGWGPDFVLGWLRENPTSDIQELLEDVAPRCGAGVEPRTLYNCDILKWRREQRDFAEQYLALIDARRPPPEGPAPWSHDACNPDWRLQWATEYLRTRNYRKAALACGMSPDTLWRKRKIGHPEFDQEFYDVWSGCQEALKEHWENTLHWARDEAVLQGDAKTAGALAVTVLERIEKERWTRAEDRNSTVNNNHNHNVHVTVELSEGAQRAMRAAELFSARVTGALGPGPITIDVPSRVVERVEAAVVR